MRTTFIYGLIDPRDGCVRYVGKADKPKDRLRRGHLHDVLDGKTTRKANWLRKLIDMDLFDQIEVRILEECGSEKAVWRECERKWIAHFGRHTLVNGTDGGEGWSGPMSEEHKRKIGEAKKGKPHPMSDATRAKISEALKGRSKGRVGNRKNAVLSAEHKAKLSAASKAHYATQMTRPRVVAALRAAGYVGSVSHSVTHLCAILDGLEILS